MSINYWELPQRQPLVHKTWHHAPTNSNLCRMPHPNSKQIKSTNSVISIQGHDPSQPCPSEEKRKTHLLPPECRHKSHPTRSLHKPLHQTYEGRKQKKESILPQSLGKGDVKHSKSLKIKRQRNTAQLKDQPRNTSPNTWRANRQTTWKIIKNNNNKDGPKPEK